MSGRTLQDPTAMDEILLEKMTAAYNLKMERKEQIVNHTKIKDIKRGSSS